MSERARTFVESWIVEHLHPVGYENKIDHSESEGNATACRTAAGIKGISRAEIDEEHIDLVGWMAQAHEKTIDRAIKHLVQKGD